MLIVWQSGQDVLSAITVQTFKEGCEDGSAHRRSEVHFRRGSVSSCCYCWCCQSWHLNVRIAAVCQKRSQWLRRKKVSTLTSAFHRIAQNLFAPVLKSTKHLVTHRGNICRTALLRYSATWNQARKHMQNNRQEFTRARKYWDWEFCQCPSVEKKTII